MLTPEKPLKMLSEELKLYDQPCKDLMGKKTQTNVLNQLERRVKMNAVFDDIFDLEADGLEVVWSLTMALWMNLDESQDLIQMKPRINLDTGLSVKFAYNFAKSATEICNKMYEPRTYNKAIDNLIHKNGWCEVI